MSLQTLTADLDELNNDNRLLAVLNAHANLVVRGHTISSELKTAFQILNSSGGVVGNRNG